MSPRTTFRYGICCLVQYFLTYSFRGLSMSQPVVLIVEDDNIARFVFKKLINKLNITCFEAENGQDALSVIDKHK